MKQIYLIARREWTAILCSPTGLGILACYLILSGYIFSTNISVTQEATLRYAFAALGALTVYIIPLITMRLLSEELRSGTFEILITNPVTDFQVILGKFFAGWLSFAVISLPSLAYLLILQIIGSPDYGPAVSCYIGQQFLAAMLTALGLMISASTQNQVLAAMGAMVGGSLFVLAGSAEHSMSGWLGRSVSYFAILDHYALFRRGVLDTRSICFFVLTTAMFLFLAIRVIESRRWKFGITPGRVSIAWNYPQLSFAAGVIAFLCFGEAFLSGISRGLWTLYNSIVFLLGLAFAGVPLWINRGRLQYELGRRQAGIVVTVITNCLLVFLIWGMAIHLSSRLYSRMDLTGTRHFTLSNQTVSILTKLSSPIQIINTINQPNDMVQEIKDLLDEYQTRSKLIDVKNVNPVRSPSEAEQWRQKYKLASPLSNEILIAAGDRYRRIPKAALLFQQTETVGNKMVTGPVAFTGEAEFTSAIIHLTHDKPGKVIILSGHGERATNDAGNEGISRAATELQRSGYLVQTQVITPGTNAKFSQDTQVVIIAGPRKQLADEDLKAVNELLDRGGGLLSLLDPGMDAGMDSLLNAWNIRLHNDIVVDKQNFVSSGDPMSLYVNRFAEEHPIGNGMKSLSAVVPSARRIAIIAANANPNVRAMYFMAASPNSWAVDYQSGEKIKIDPKKDHQGPIPLGVGASRYQEFSEPGMNPLKGSMVAIGDSDFVTNQYIDMAGNLNLFLNAVDWLGGRFDTIAVRPKISDTRMMLLTTRQMKWVYWWSIVIIPGIVIAASAFWILRRRYSV